MGTKEEKVIVGSMLSSAMPSKGPSYLWHTQTFIHSGRAS